VLLLNIDIVVRTHNMLLLLLFQFSALLGYAKELEYGDAMVQSTSLTAWFHNVSTKFLIGGAIALPNVFQRFLPQPGEGPDRATMEAGFMDLTAIATLIDDKDGKESRVISKFHFGKDVGYLYTAGKGLVEGYVMDRWICWTTIKLSNIVLTHIPMHSYTFSQLFLWKREWS
jgi:hypothetical protein